MKTLLPLLCILCASAVNPAFGGEALAPAGVLAHMHRVADWQLDNMPPTADKYTGDPASMPRIAKAHPTRLDWTFAAYYAGHLALAGLSPRSADYLDTFAKLGREENWRLPFRGTRYHADDHAIGQCYLEYALRAHDSAAVGPTQEFFDFLLANPPKNPDALAHDISTKSRQFLEKWSWCDALFMAPPSLARLYEYTGDIRYLDYMNDRWWHTTAYLYDKDEHLYYRDSRYFEKREANGQKVFWGRGNGWVLGGLARILQSMPAAYPDRPRYEQLFRDMCGRFLALQGADGLWRASLLDPASYPAPETSSTGFAAYAFAWGVNAGLLDRAAYWPATLKAWRGLLSHVTPEGKVGSCQPIGADPRKITEDDTDVYGPGAFLLAGAEIYKALLLEQNPHGILSVQNPTGIHRRWSTVEVSAARLRELTGTDNPADILVFDALTPLLRDTQTWQTDAGPALLFQATIPPNDTRRFILVRKPAGFQGPQPVPLAHARFAPDRHDDYIWENDRVAHRVYGPALVKKEGTDTNGIDVFVKSTPALVMDDFYKRGDYHRDHGKGYDPYAVGQSRGLGAPAFRAAGAGAPWHSPGNYATHRPIADGPIRATFELTYPPVTIPAAGAATITFTETRRFTLDAGSHFTRLDSTIAVTPVGASFEIAPALARNDWPGRKKHAPKPALADTPDTAAQPAASDENWLADWQPNKGENDATGLAVWFPADTAMKPVEGHWLLPAIPVPADAGTATWSATWYIGATWSKSWHPTLESWRQTVTDFIKTTETPLRLGTEK
ncbi:glycoside hydrolase family 88 protein [Termitidicoccus mucosus]|uniref:Glycosyl hydrolase family 88 n=1 Tax=Termitidicoccus mucosus TaxID=1184151 RepID=A0A178IKK5_9BACT|nr:hypothetical protein AW736_00955 [Opitutaceae bacterium TSB47]